MMREGKWEEMEEEKDRKGKGVHLSRIQITEKWRTGDACEK